NFRFDPGALFHPGAAYHAGRARAGAMAWPRVARGHGREGGSMKWDWDIARQAMPHLVDGISITAATTAGGMALALVIGLLFAVGRRNRQSVISWLFVGVIEFIRCTPLLVQLFLAYYIVPDFGWNGP